MHLLVVILQQVVKLLLKRKARLQPEVAPVRQPGPGENEQSSCAGLKAGTFSLPILSSLSMEARDRMLTWRMRAAARLHRDRLGPRGLR